MRAIFKIVILVILSFIVSCYQEIVVFDSEPDAKLQLSSIIRLNGKDAFLDSGMNMLRFPVSRESLTNFSAFTTFNEKSQVWFEDRELHNNRVNEFGNVEFGKSYSLRVKYEGVNREFGFVFTNLPIIQIITDTKIWDEPKSLARLVVAEPDKPVSWSSYAGVEYRGQSSRYLDKKSIGFSLWESITNTTEYSTSLMGFNSNSDWILNSAAVDPSGIRNLVSFELWGKLGKNESKSDDIHPGVKLKIAELFINNGCQGFYVFSERVNEQLLNAAPGDVLFKAIEWSDGATKFERYNPDIFRSCIWNGWEQIIPDCEDYLHWKHLKNLYEIVVESNDSIFRQNIFGYIDKENFIDYFIFLNLTLAGDNTGKNTFLYRKNSSGLFQIIPWDLDATWGISFDGTPQTYDGILVNALYQRLLEADPENFTATLKYRWIELRETHFKERELKYQFAFQFQLLHESGIVDVENWNWEKNMNLQSEQVYIEMWLAQRLTYLDNYFNALE